MSHVKIDSIRSSSSGTIGRAVSQSRNARLTLDSSRDPFTVPVRRGMSLTKQGGSAMD